MAANPPRGRTGSVRSKVRLQLYLHWGVIWPALISGISGSAGAIIDDRHAHAGNMEPRLAPSS